MRKEVVNRKRELARGGHLFRVTEDILVAMEDLGISKAELARRLGLSKPRITQLLSGDSNMTIGTLSDIAFELGLSLDKTFKEYSEQRYRLPDGQSNEEKVVQADFAVNSINQVRARALESLAANDVWTSVSDNVIPLRRTG